MYRAPQGQVWGRARPLRLVFLIPNKLRSACGVACHDQTERMDAA